VLPDQSDRVTSSSRRSPSRRYPPLLAALLAVIIATFVLPSSLKLQQANPTQTEQFAPVPSAQHETATPLGNLSSLSLGTSASLSSDGAGGTGLGGSPTGNANPALPGLPPIPGGAGAIPDQYPCVGNPPHQTADPLSPPCVAYYNGNNGGATYQGVTGRQITVLIYVDPGTPIGTSDGTENETAYSGEYFNLQQPIPSNVHSVTLRNYQRFQKYFNYHYATYNRYVDFWLYFSECSGGCAAGLPTVQTRVSDAAANYAKLHPFAVVTSAAADASPLPYEDYMASRGVLSFGSFGLNPATTYQQYPGHIWDYLPTLEQQAATFSSYACQKVLGQPVVNSGNAGEDGKPRVLGLITMADPDFPNLIRYGALVKSEVEACGGRFAASGTVPVEGEDPDSAYAAQNMAAFKEAGVTTIIWPGGDELVQSQAAAALGYYPEWIIGGDGQDNDDDASAMFQSRAEWDHAWVVTFWPLHPVPRDQICRQAIAEVDPNAGDDAYFACFFTFYEDLRQMFTGIQVAGPDLTPASIDEGFHAIPPVASTNPQVPACYYPPGEYTCIQDSVVEHWNFDVDGTGNYDAGTNTQGCWLMLGGGARTIDGQRWPAGNIDAQYSPDDPCNVFT